MRHVILVSDIEGFSPVDTNDFDNKAIYNAFWRDCVVDGNTGFYSAQVLALGMTTEEVEDSQKRVPVPKVIVEEGSDDETLVQRRRQEAKKTNQSASKKDSYVKILNQHISQAHKKKKKKKKKKPHRGFEATEEPEKGFRARLTPTLQLILARSSNIQKEKEKMQRAPGG
ncbi:hypothetical protein ISCGN_001140 [Ixodes scapularis]